MLFRVYMYCSSAFTVCLCASLSYFANGNGIVCVCVCVCVCVVWCVCVVGETERYTRESDSCQSAQDRVPQG